ncbi:DUF6064 family protein [Microbulbifer guangxiensis]|uniref:DUF6064 family protein n=1 Tax=Microbulbifer guangxiensis TaxID=2904249 RepID=UPI001F21694F|nr:DUF6064 family protein [Microbulbifer guangxiensis]
MSDWSSYRLQDLIPFTQEVYLRLLQRVSEDTWPLQIALLVLGLAAFALALAHRNRLALIFLAPAWICSGLVFHLQHYAELNWAAPYLGLAFLAQGVILSLLGLTGVGIDRQKSFGNLPALIGLSSVLIGVVAYPLIAPLAGFSWMQAESFGVHADPTALTTLGFCLVVLRRTALWLASIIPLSGALLSGLTLLALALPWASALLGMLGVILTALVWKTVASARGVSDGS